MHTELSDEELKMILKIARKRGVSVERAIVQLAMEAAKQLAKTEGMKILARVPVVRRLM